MRGSATRSSRRATGPTTDRNFYALSADFGTFAGGWDLSLYGISQDYFGLTDRQAVGTEVRYFRQGLTFVGLADYDIHYQELNNLLLLGTIALPARWTMSVNLDHRKSPSLAARNAMIGQPVTSFDELFGLFSIERDRAAGARPHGRVRRLHAVAVAAARRALAVVDGFLERQSRSDARFGGALPRRRTRAPT